MLLKIVFSVCMGSTFVTIFILIPLLLFFPKIRKVKNVTTGIHMNVPSYVPADSPRNVKYFRVVVISKLSHFKQEKHSEGDTVQFMVCTVKTRTLLLLFFDNCVLCQLLFTRIVVHTRVGINYM